MILFAEIFGLIVALSAIGFGIFLHKETKRMYTNKFEWEGDFFNVQTYDNEARKTRFTTKNGGKKGAGHIPNDLLEIYSSTYTYC